MSHLGLDALRACLEGVVPAFIATVDPEGMPNVAHLSQVHYVDDRHLALSFQFFNKTRANILANPHAELRVAHPDTAAWYALEVEYLRTETAGPLFESMKARLAGIASHTGMSKVFQLRGADVYRVHAIQPIPGRHLRPPLAVPSLLPPLRAALGRLAVPNEPEALAEALLDGVESDLNIRHVMLFMHDTPGGRLYTLASRGYAASGIGSEIPMGAGVVGVAARENTPIRIGYWTAEYTYGQAVRHTLEHGDIAPELDMEIPLPGLAEPHSQLAVPFGRGGVVYGVLYVESPESRRFSHEHEDTLAILAQHFALAWTLIQQASENGEPPAAIPPSMTVRKAGPPLTLRHYAWNDSVFVEDGYLIKGVAGAIFWKLLGDYSRLGRTEFSNRELRLDPAIRLPELSDNLEARLILLQKRLRERCPWLALEKTGRGRFHLRVERPVRLEEMADRPA